MEMEDTLLLLLPPSSSSSSSSSSLHLPSKRKKTKKNLIPVHQLGKYEQTDSETGNNDTSWATTIGNKYHVAGRRSSLHPIIHLNIPAVSAAVQASLWPSHLHLTACVCSEYQKYFISLLFFECFPPLNERIPPEHL